MRALKALVFASYFILTLYMLVCFFYAKKPFSNKKYPYKYLSNLTDRMFLTSIFRYNISNYFNFTENINIRNTSEGKTFITLQEEEMFNYDNSLFLIEGFSKSNFKQRFLCSIESAALVHPNCSVSVMMTSPRLQLTKSIKILLNLYNNIRFIFLNTTKLYLNSPLKKWFLNKTWKGTKYPEINFCDPLRYLILWKYGGIYLDLDVISLRDLRREENFLGIEYPVVNSAVMGFRKKHPFIEECIRKIENTSPGNKWGVYGPALNTEVLTNRCGLSLPSSRLPSCPDIKLYKEKTFYSLRGRVAKKYSVVNKALSNSILNDQEILAFHFYNHISQKLELPLKRLTPIGEITRRFCPIVSEGVNYVFKKKNNK